MTYIKKTSYISIRKGKKGNIGRQNSPEIVEIIRQKALLRYQNPEYKKLFLLKATSKEKKEKISNSKRGKPRSEETKQKLRIAAKLQWARGNNGYHPNKLVASNRKKRTWIEQQIKNLLDKNNIQYEEQKRIGRFFPDFIVKNKLIIECDGEHWHTNKEYELKREQYLKNFGYNILRLSGKDINNNIQYCNEKINKELENI